MDQQELSFDAYADTDEMGCGSLAVALRSAMLELPAGAVLKVRALDSGAPEDIPAWCRLSGHSLLAEPAAAGAGLYFIRKGGGPAQ